MKKIVVLLIILLASCGPLPEDTNDGKYKNIFIPYSETPQGISVQKVDNCEYIYCETKHGVAIIHKQNCKNH